MKYYQEITLIPHAELALNFIWSKLYAQLHLALVELQDEQGRVPVGVSLPKYQLKAGKHISPLGEKLRVFAEDEATLQQLNLSQWLNRLLDYVHLTGIRPVPEKVNGYARYQRRQFNGSPENMARRRVKRKGDISFEQAVALYETQVVHSNLPYIRLKSLSNAQGFNLFIEKKPADEAGGFSFGTYGLSSSASVPEF